MRGRTNSPRPSGATTWWLRGEEPAQSGRSQLSGVLCPHGHLHSICTNTSHVHTDTGFVGPRTQTRPRLSVAAAAEAWASPWSQVAVLFLTVVGFPVLSLFRLFTTYLLASWRHPPSDGWVSPSVSTLPRFFFFNLKTNHTVLWDRTGLYVYGVGTSQFGGKRHFQLCSLFPHTCAYEV